MRMFLATLVICVLVMLTGCAGRRAAEVEPQTKVGDAGEEITAVIDECSRLASFGSGEVSGWDLARPIDTYDKKSIFDYINGAAELYFVYDFRGVAAAEYQDGKTSIIIDVYDMATPDGAFGIYSLNRYPEANYVDMGNEGILTGAALDFWKGRYFCKVYSFDPSGKYQKDVVNFGSKLASKIQEAGEEPSVLGKLPQNGLVPRTAMFFSRKLALDNIRYVSEDNVFSLNEKTKGVVAEYQIDNTAFQLFAIEYPSSEEASSAFEAYSRYLDEKGEPVPTSETVHEKSRIVKVNDKLTFVGLKGWSLIGFWDVETREAAESILKNIN